MKPHRLLILLISAFSLQLSAFSATSRFDNITVTGNATIDGTLSVPETFFTANADTIRQITGIDDVQPLSIGTDAERQAHAFARGELGLVANDPDPEKNGLIYAGLSEGQPGGTLLHAGLFTKLLSTPDEIFRHTPAAESNSLDGIDTHLGSINTQGLPLTVLHKLFEFPPARPATSNLFWVLPSTEAQAGSTGYGFQLSLYIGSRRVMVLRQNSGSGTAREKVFDYVAFAGHRGSLATLIPARAEPSIFLNGKKLEPTGEYENGTPAEWGTWQGKYYRLKTLGAAALSERRPLSSASPGILIIGELTPDEIAAWSRHGRLPLWATIPCNTTPQTEGLLILGAKYRIAETSEEFIADTTLYDYPSGPIVRYGMAANPTPPARGTRICDDASGNDLTTTIGPGIAIGSQQKTGAFTTTLTWANSAAEQIVGGTRTGGTLWDDANYCIDTITLIADTAAPAVTVKGTDDAYIAPVALEPATPVQPPLLRHNTPDRTLRVSPGGVFTGTIKLRVSYTRL